MTKPTTPTPTPAQLKTLRLLAQGTHKGHLMTWRALYAAGWVDGGEDNRAVLTDAGRAVLAAAGEG